MDGQTTKLKTISLRFAGDNISLFAIGGVYLLDPRQRQHDLASVTWIDRVRCVFVHPQWVAFEIDRL